MTKTLSVADAKAHLSECIRAAEHGVTVVITRRGRLVVALVPAADLPALAGPSAGLAGMAGGWKGSQELVENVRRIRRSRSRPLPRFD